MILSEESLSIRAALGVFLQEIAFVDRRWIRIDSCSNRTFHKPAKPGGGTNGETKEVDCPLESFSDLLGINAEKANEYLYAANLMELNNRHKTLGPNIEGWEALKSEFVLEIETVKAGNIHYLGKRMHVMMIGSLCDDNPKPFSAKDQAKRFFDENAWKPKRLRATVQAKEFLSKTSLDLTIIMAKQQKELDEKEAEADEAAALAAASVPDKSEESVPYKSPAKSQSVMFDMKDANESLSCGCRLTVSRGQPFVFLAPRREIRFESAPNKRTGLSRFSIT
jgi:hypothetical protein